MRPVEDFAGRSERVQSTLGFCSRSGGEGAIEADQLSVIVDILALRFQCGAGFGIVFEWRIGIEFGEAGTGKDARERGQHDKRYPNSQTNSQDAALHAVPPCHLNKSAGVIALPTRGRRMTGRPVRSTAATS